MINTNYASLNNRVSSQSWQTPSVTSEAQEKETATQSSKASTFSDTAAILTLSKQTDGVRLKTTEATTYAKDTSTQAKSRAQNATKIYEVLMK